MDFSLKTVQNSSPSKHRNIRVSVPGGSEMEFLDPTVTVSVFTIQFRELLYGESVLPYLLRQETCDKWINCLCLSVLPEDNPSYSITVKDNNRRVKTRLRWRELNQNVKLMVRFVRDVKTNS